MRLKVNPSSLESSEHLAQEGKTDLKYVNPAKACVLKPLLPRHFRRAKTLQTCKEQFSASSVHRDECAFSVEAQKNRANPDERVV